MCEKNFSAHCHGRGLLFSATKNLKKTTYLTPLKFLGKEILRKVNNLKSDSRVVFSPNKSGFIALVIRFLVQSPRSTSSSWPACDAEEKINRKWKPGNLFQVWTQHQRGEEQGSKSPFSLLSEPVSPSSLLFISSSRSIQSISYSQLFFFSLLPTFYPYFSLLPTFFGPFLPPPYSVSPPSTMTSADFDPIFPIFETSQEMFSWEYFTEMLLSYIFGPIVVKYGILSDMRHSKLHTVIDYLFLFVLEHSCWLRLYLKK